MSRSLGDKKPHDIGVIEEPGKLKEIIMLRVFRCL